jgi:hypothetical protein
MVPQDCCTYGCYREDRVFLKLLAILVSELVKSKTHIAPPRSYGRSI